MLTSPEVVVVGSANIDVRLQVDDVPRRGETVLARRRELGAGGKGANQAIAAARSGARTTFIGAVGNDEAATVLVDALGAAGVDASWLRTSDVPTGTAYVVVDEAGDNLIVVDAGANGALVDLSADERAVIGEASVVLCQLEVPVETVLAAAIAATGTVILNAAPAMALSDELLSNVDLLVVNEHEARAVAAHAAAGPTTDTADLDVALEALLSSVPIVVVTCGAAGAVIASRDAPAVQVPALPARAVVDTTGAGDTFCGTLAGALAMGAPLAAAARRAAAAASLAVERPGAAESAPTGDEVAARLAEVGGAP